jgi:hypothetical protein
VRCLGRQTNSNDDGGGFEAIAGHEPVTGSGILEQQLLHKNEEQNDHNR